MSDDKLASSIIDAFENLLRGYFFCLPAHVTAFDEDTQLAQVQPDVQLVDTANNNSGVTIPVVENVPVQFAGNDEFYFFHKVQSGTQGILVYSQRSIDEWTTRGGLVTPADTRMLSGDDAFFIAGIRSSNNAIPSFKNEGCGLSNFDGTKFIHIKDDKIEVESDGDLSATITGNTSITTTGDTSITTTGTTTVNATDDLTVNATADLIATVGGDLTATATGNANITSTGDTTVTAPTIALVGNVTITGNVETFGTLENNGTNVGSTHVHGAVMNGPSTTSTPS